MQISNIQSTNFKSGYSLKRLTPQSKRALRTSIPEGAKVFENFRNRKDCMFIAVNSQDDNQMKATFKKLLLYYTAYPQVVPHIKALEDEDGLRALLDNLMLKNEDVTQVLKSLNISSGGFYVRESDHGEKIIQNKISMDKIYVSPGNAFGTHYVKIVPLFSSTDLESRYVAMKKNKIIREYSTPDEVKRFNKLYNDTLIYFK